MNRFGIFGVVGGVGVLKACQTVKPCLGDGKGPGGNSIVGWEVGIFGQLLNLHSKSMRQGLNLEMVHVDQWGDWIFCVLCWCVCLSVCGGVGGWLVSVPV